jgi:hypothetical protein
MIIRSLFAGLFLATASCNAVIPLITQSDLTGPSTFAQEVGKLNSERTWKTLVTAPIALSAYALLHSSGRLYDSTPFGSADTSRRINNLQSTARENPWFGLLKYTIQLTLGSLVLRTIANNFPSSLTPHWGLMLRFPVWDTYPQPRLFSSHICTILRNINNQNASTLRRETALFAKTSLQIIIDIRYIVTQLWEDQKLLAQELTNAANTLLTLTNQLIDKVNKNTIDWKATKTATNGLNSCIKSINLLVPKANTRFEIIQGERPILQWVGRKLGSIGKQITGLL